jgi:hypothetical protein
VFLAAVGAEQQTHTIVLLDELNRRPPSRAPTADTQVPR